MLAIIAEEAFYDLDGPVVRITTPHIPLPAADNLEDMVLPTPARIADRIAVIADGGISELGSHDELVRAGGRYAQLFELQAAGYR
mgnify:CR=1 FL=1